MALTISYSPPDTMSSASSSMSASTSLRVPSNKSRASSSTTSKTSASSISSSNTYGRTLHEAYTQWKLADDATQRLPLEERDKAECGQELATARKMLANLLAERPSRHELRKRKSSKLLNMFAKDKQYSQSVAHLPLQAPPDAKSELLDSTLEVNELERRYHNLTVQVEATKVAAATLDECFDALRSNLDNGPLPSWRFIQGNEHSITRAEKSVASREEAYDHSVAMTEAFERARAFAQSAHHHYSQAMDLVDSVCSPSRSTWAAVMGDEQSKEQTYKEAGSWAEKAQVCFNECLRVLAPYVDVLQNDEREAFERLKEAGLLQAISLYKLMYGGKALNFGISQQVQLILQKQAAVFGLLTHLAVGIQNCTKHCASVQQTAREKRDATRRQVVALWMNDGNYLVPLSP